MAGLAIFGVPGLVALPISFLAAGSGRRIAALIGLGAALGIAFILAAYYSSPIDYEHSDGCSDCEEFLGRWWEPRFVVMLCLLGLGGWLLGVGLGVTLRSLLRRDGRASRAGSGRT